MMLPSDREEEVFCNALEIADPAQRKAYLDQHCDPTLRETVESMLADFERADTVFEECGKSLTWTPQMEKEAVDATTGDAFIGRTVGYYHITHFLGKGGSGFVYEANQEAPVKRTVALKILRPGRDSQKVIARFEAERQTLAMMEHHNIASVIDAGTTEQGHPYFVMERVRGTRITDFCQETNASLEERLRLLISVCAAIQHAHQKGIIHLDLKPSNILISQIEERPIPKVIDFGIAQAIAEQCLSDGDETQISLAGTPKYMSPEQSSGEFTSDTRSDIFSLGVILDDLAGDWENSKTAGDRAKSARIPRDLEMIVQKATAKKPEDRYHTVRGLAKDLEYFLEDRPIEAHPPSTLYRARKLLARNRLTSGAIALAIVAMLIGLTTSTVLLFRAKAAERKESELRIAAEERERVTKSANFIMQGKLAEADQEIEQLAGPLTQTSVEASFVFWELGIWNGLRKNWETASERLLALARVNRFDESDQSDNATRNYLPIGPTLIKAGRNDEYWDFHYDLIKRKGSSENPIAAEQMLKGGLLLPGDEAWLSQMESLATVVEDSLAANNYQAKDWLEAWRCAVLGLWHYRKGEFAKSIVWCDRGASFEDEQISRQAYCQTIKAMALYKLGQLPEALTQFQDAQHRIESTLAGPLEYHMQGFWHDWIAAGILLQEAEQTLSSERLLL
ncbi:serine/threonine-protein kinase [Pelagicoccus sp. SDUM812003]|uniref:serine/threonine protein kinase n=1 Tax=Pelagicoccus sp. SDUM812003 TaxID=3041267 RepID=UPI00280D5892|nr:serine/threonine-protein kinase [Pelagicoccus sp. SDUM812003]MDQ8203493.1 serine/threonine-protein kinase [Pelagicoccus sp. SDUM812003]